MPPKTKKNSDIPEDGDEPRGRGRPSNSTSDTPARTRSLSRARGNQPLLAQMDRAHEEQARRLELIMNTLQQQSEVMQECLTTVGNQGRDLLRLRNQVDQLPKNGSNNQPQGFSFQQPQGPATTSAALTPTSAPIPIPVIQIQDHGPAQVVPSVTTASAPPSASAPEPQGPGRVMYPSAQGFQPAGSGRTVHLNLPSQTASAANNPPGPVVSQPQSSGAQGPPLPLDHTPLVHKPAVMDLLNQRGGPGANNAPRSASAPRTSTRQSSTPPIGRATNPSPPVNRAPAPTSNTSSPSQGYPPTVPTTPNQGFPQNNQGNYNQGNHPIPHLAPQNHGQTPNNAQGYQQPPPPVPPAQPATPPQQRRPRAAMPGAGGGGGGDGGDGDGNGPNHQYGMGYRAARAARANNNNNGIPQVGLLDPAVRERGKVLSQIRLPKFSNRSTTDHWIQQVREAHEVYNTTDQEIIYVAKNAMHGEVAAAVRDLNTADMTVEDFFAAIRKEVLPTDNRAHARAALTGLYQGKKDLYDFKHHTLSLTMRAHDLNVEGAQRIGVLSFIGGLADEEISDKVLDKDPQTIEEAYILADRFQAIARDKARRKRLSAVYKDRDPDEIDVKETVDINFMKRGFEANKASQKDTTRDLGARIDRRLEDTERLIKKIDSERGDEIQRIYSELKDTKKQLAKSNRADRSAVDNHNRYRGKENQPPRQNSAPYKPRYNNNNGNNNHNGGNNSHNGNNNHNGNNGHSYGNNNNNGNYSRNGPNNNQQRQQGHQQRHSDNAKRSWTPRQQTAFNKITGHIRQIISDSTDENMEEVEANIAEGANISEWQDMDDALRDDYGSDDEYDDHQYYSDSGDDQNSSN